jgi:hypothetical protein
MSISQKEGKRRWIERRVRKNKETERGERKMEDWKASEEVKGNRKREK